MSIIFVSFISFVLAQQSILRSFLAGRSPNFSMYSCAFLLRNSFNSGILDLIILIPKAYVWPSADSNNPFATASLANFIAGILESFLADPDMISDFSSSSLSFHTINGTPVFLPRWVATLLTSPGY